MTAESIRIEDNVKRLSETIKGLQIILGVLATIVVGAFVAGVYYSDILRSAKDLITDVNNLKASSAAHDVAIAELHSSDTTIRQGIGPAFASFRDGLTILPDAVVSTEPADNGGGNLAKCLPGSVMVALQLYKYDGSGIREIRVQCARFPDVALN